MSASARELRGCSWLASCLGFALACAWGRSSLQPDDTPPALAASSGGQPTATAAAWAAESRSPSRGELAEVPLPGCAADEQALRATAQVVADREAAGQPGWEIVDVVARLRAAGSPYVWPRLWTVRASTLDAPAVTAGLTAWLGEMPASGQRRCGVARATQPGGGEVLSVLTVDVLADLAPLPTRVRLGQWLRLRARLLVPASNAETVLLGPRGLPRVIPTELRPGEVRAVFSLDQPGMWRVQLLLVTERGPRPALEAWTFVDVEPTPSAAMTEAPGESLATGEAADPSELLLELLNAARRSEQRPALRRDERLDRLARAHAEAMLRSRLTAHDAGDGLPSERLRRAGITASLVGENVAHASDLRRAHRALWDSPAHRATLLDPRFEAVGLGVAVERESPAVETTQTTAETQSTPLAANSRPLELRPKPGAGKDGGPATFRGDAPAPAVPGRAVHASSGAVWVCELFANYR